MMGLSVMKRSPGKLIFSSGKVVDVNGYVGLDDRLHVSEGYDGNLYHPLDDWERECGVESESLTPEERVELANYMIGQWLSFRRQAQIESGCCEQPVEDGVVEITNIVE